MVYSVVEGVTSLSQIQAADQQKITDTVIARLNVGGSATLSEVNNLVIINLNYTPHFTEEVIVVRFNQTKADIIANMNWPVPIPNITGLSDATPTIPDDGGPTDPDPDPDVPDIGGPAGGAPGKQTDSGIVYSLLEGVASLSSLTTAEQTKITDTVSVRLNISALGGSSELTTINELVVLQINCPAQIPSDSMASIFNNSKPDLLANINFPTPISNLTGFGDAIIKPSSGEVIILPSGPKIRFQLQGVITLENLSEDVQKSIRETTANITGVPSTRIGVSYVDGGVYVQLVKPDGKDLRQFGEEVKQHHDTLATKLEELSPNITGIGAVQASAEDLGFHTEEAKVTVSVQGLTSLSEITSGVKAAEAAIAGSIGLPAENVELKEKDGGLIVVFTPTSTHSAEYITQLLPNANIAYILNNMSGGNHELDTGTPNREVESKDVAIKLKNMNTSQEYDVTVDTASTLGAFKVQVEALTQISPGNQIIAFGGSQVIEKPDDTTLGEMGVVANGLLIGVFSTSFEPPSWGTVNPPGNFKMVGYYAAWGVYMRQFFLSGIDVSRLTHLNYAFANISNDGDCVMGDDWADPKNFDMLTHIKKKNPHLKTLLSVGGWTWSVHFSDLARTSAGRARFARTAAQLMRDNGFDGIDIDWEFPVKGGSGDMIHRAEDADNYPLLMQAIRNEIGWGKLLTMAVTPNPHYHRYLRLPQLSNICDWINLMAYDYNGPWPGCEKSNFNAALFRAHNDPSDPEFNIHSSIETLLEGGLPRHKLVMGLSFYGRGFANVEPGPNGDGLYQPYSGRPFGTWPDEFNQASGVFDYYDLRDNYIGKSDWQDHYSDEAEAAWLYSPSRKEMIGYDNPTTIWAKCSYILSRGLGGAMIWDHSMDRGNQLLYVAHEVLKPNGTDISGAKSGEAVPKNASGSSWDDKNVASGKISSIHFRIDQDRVYGMKVEYDSGNESDWHGSSTAGHPITVDIPANIGIKRLTIYTSSKIIQAIGLVYTNGTSTIVGTMHSRKSETFYMRVPYGAIISHFKGKANSGGLTQINCSFKTLPGHDFSRHLSEDRFLRKMINTETAGQKQLDDYYLAKGKIELSPEKLRQAASRASRKSGAPEIAPLTIEPEDGMQYRIKAGTGDWQIGYGPRLETAPEAGGGFIMEYAVRSYLGATGVVIGDEDNPAFQFSWQAPVMDMSTAAGVLVKDGSVSITGSVLGQGGTLTINEHGVNFAGTLGPVTFDAGIGDQGVKFFATTSNGLFGGGLEIGPNRFAIGITLFGFSLRLDIGALIRGEISWADIGMGILNGMLQIAWGFVRLMVTAIVAFFTFGLVHLSL